MSAIYSPRRVSDSHYETVWLGEWADPRTRLEFDIEGELHPAEPDVGYPRDSYEVKAEMISATVGDLPLSRDAMIQMIGADGVTALEDMAARQYEESQP